MKYIKVFLLVIVLFLINSNVKSKEAEDYCKDTSVKDECVNTVKYCYMDEEFEGCAFDDKEPIYSTSKSTSEFNYAISPAWAYSALQWTYIDNDVPLERSYVVVDKNNNVGFVGCYKGEIELRPQTYDPSTEDLNLAKKCNSSSEKCLGTAYFFKMIMPDKHTCIPTEKRVSLYFSVDSKAKDLLEEQGVEINDYNDRLNSLGIGRGNWVPKGTGNCPKYLNFNSDISDFFSPDNRYQISDDQDMIYDKNKLEAILDFFTHTYSNTHEISGCTTQDTVGVEEMKQCFTDRAESIKKFNCPDDASGYDKLKEDFDNYQKVCKEKYDELYSRKLITESSEKYLKIINDAVVQRVDECYADKCGVDPSKIKEQTKGTICQDGCVSSAKDQSDSSSASCWVCGTSPNYFYKWIDSSETSKYSSCHPESISKEECYGTTNERDCRSCLQKAYTEMGLTSEQISCINEAESVKNKIIKDIEDSSNQHDEEQIDENASNTAHKSFFSIPDLLGWSFGDSLPCDKVFGAKTGLKIIKGIIIVLRIGGAIIAIANAMITLIPAVISKDADGLKKAGRKLVVMAVVLAIIGILPSIVHLIGLVFGYDLSCIF
ncbi:MAG: hypothetical protein IJK67_05325 [Bacilli bacterium]|nr:hypothetical protein [Bacilli bacterium]